LRRVVAILIVGAVAVGAGWLIIDLPGTVRVQIFDLVIDTSAAVALVFLLCLTLAVHILLRCLGWFLRLPTIARRWRSVRRRNLGDQAVTRALVALAAGTGGPATKEAARARALLGDTAQTLLLLAEAERLAGREDRAERAFATLAKTADTALIGLRGLLRQAVAREDWAEADRLARRAEAAHPGARWAREERLRLAIRAGDWRGALALATTDTARAALCTAAANAATDPEQARQLARDGHRADPGLEAAAVAYARALRQLGDESGVRAAARAAWKTAPSAELAALALEPVADRLALVSAARGLVELAPDHTESHILLARVAMDAGLQGMARDHLDVLRRRESDDRRVWDLLAEAASDPVARTDATRRADALKHRPGWRCEGCGSSATAWEPACRTCLTAGALRRATAVGSPRLVAA
jgi:HemY protein